MPGYRTLVVDDDAVTRQLLLELFAEEGYDVRAAADGIEALDVLRSWRADVVVLDAVMPRADAAAFRAAQTAIPALRDVPVVVLSASRLDELDPLARRLGAEAALVKPFDVDELLAVVRRVVDREAAPRA
ncbi:MAG TPA: response regulator [Chloroflexota bacterium]|nr:response regulator [Chloroflexota bacterium]